MLGDVGQPGPVRRGGERGSGALLGTQARGFVLPGGKRIGDEPVPERAQHLPRDAAVVATVERLWPFPRSLCPARRRLDPVRLRLRRL